MSIFNKIFRGTVANDETGDPLRTGGQIVNDNFDIAETALLDRLLRVDSVQNIAGLVGDYDGQQISLLGYHPDSDIGGGKFYWDASGDKANHNGGTVIDPDKTFPTDWNNSTQVADWFTADTGTGVWRRQYLEPVHVKWFGARGDSNLDLIPIQTAIDNSVHMVTGGNDTYYLGEMNSASDDYFLIIKDRDELSVDLFVTFIDTANSNPDLPNAVIRIEDSNNIKIKLKANEITLNYDDLQSTSAVHIQAATTNCYGFNIEVISDTCRAGISSYMDGDFTISDVDLDVTTKDCLYGIRLIKNVYNITGIVRSTKVKRTVFLERCHRVTLISQSTGQYENNDILLKSYAAGAGCSNVSINHNQVDSTSSEWPVVIESQLTSGASVFSNIDITLNTNKSGIYQASNKGMFAIASRAISGALNTFSGDTYNAIKLALNGSWKNDIAYQSVPLIDFRSILTTRPIIECNFNPKVFDTKRSTIKVGRSYYAAMSGDLGTITSNNLYAFIDGTTADLDITTIELFGGSSVNTETSNNFYGRYIGISSQNVSKNVNLIDDVNLTTQVTSATIRNIANYVRITALGSYTNYGNSDSYLMVKVTI